MGAVIEAFSCVLKYINLVAISVTMVTFVSQSKKFKIYASNSIEQISDESDSDPSSCYSGRIRLSDFTYR